MSRNVIVSSEWFDDFLAGFTAYYLTSLPVFLGVLFGVDFPRLAEERSPPPSDVVSACVYFDAWHYLEIVEKGYSYNPSRQSMVAFFPAYPLVSRWLSQITGLSPREAALLTAHAALLGVFVVLARFVRLRWSEAATRQRAVVLTIFGLWPLGLFFRMPYPESMFLLFVLAGMLLALGGWKRWLTGSELVLGTSLLAIPYLTRAYEMSMAAHGRFAAVVVVNYLVIGRMLARASPLTLAAICTIFALALCLFSALYATNHLIF